jgi:hypothetical protein
MERIQKVNIRQVVNNMLNIKHLIILIIVVFVMQVPVRGENKPPAFKLKKTVIYIDNKNNLTVPAGVQGAKIIIKNSELPSEFVIGDNEIIAPTPTGAAKNVEPDDLAYVLKTPVSGTGLNNILNISEPDEDNSSKRIKTFGLVMILFSAGAGLIYLFIPKKKPENPVME